MQAQYRVIYLDGVYFPIQHEDQVDSTPLLVALGVDLAGHKEIPGFVVAGAESADAWQGLVDDLKQRGIQKADLLVTDGDEGLIGVLDRAFGASKRQRCITHKMRNVLAKAPQRAKKEVADALKGVFASPHVLKLRPIWTPSAHATRRSIPRVSPRCAGTGQGTIQ